MREWLNMIRASVLVLWPVTTWATGASLGSTLGAITTADWLALAVLSGVSGLVALLYRVRKSFEAMALQQAGEPAQVGDRLLIDWRLFALCHMTGAMFVGALAFLLGNAVDMNSYFEAAAIALASWSGAKLADKLADLMSDRLSSALGKAG